MGQKEQTQKPKKIPMRQCLGCNAHKPKKEMIRVVRLPDGGVVLDLKGKVSGRGAYICPDKNCFKKARKSKRIENTLECEIREDIYDAMEEMISEDSAK
jgi:predicted RNA-binding protein YlxR (DUF448 family)